MNLKQSDDAALLKQLKAIVRKKRDRIIRPLPTVEAGQQTFSG